MKRLSYLLSGLLAFALTSCSKTVEEDSYHTLDWDSRMVEVLPDSLITGSSYLSVYSEIYSNTEARTVSLTATISIRNINDIDTLYIQRADLFDSNGNKVYSFTDRPVQVLPLETLELIVDQTNHQGGSGGNMIFDWSIHKGSIEPHFEAVMISTSGQQGIAFRTEAIHRKK